MKLSQIQKLKFARIIFNSPGTEQQQINNLTDEQLEMLRSIYAQKIAYESVNGKIQAFFHQDQPQQAHEPRIPNLLTSVCCCFYPAQNRDYFDINTSLFFTRLFYPFLFWNNGFLNINQGKGELYGIIWIILTYTIILGLSATLNLYFIDPQNFIFDNTMMISALGITVIFQVAEPLIYSSVIGCLGGYMYSNQGVMLSGYSLVLYFIPTLFCIIPSLYWHMIMMAAGSIFRAIFLVRNYSTKLQSKAYIIFLVIFILQAVYLVIAVRVMFQGDVGFGFQQGFDAVFGTTPHITTASLSFLPSENWFSSLRHFQI